MRRLKIEINAFVIVMSFALASLSNFNTSPAWACECLPSKSPSEELKWATAVFAGEVSSIKTENNTITVELKVEKVWKGQIAKRTFVETSKWGSECGYSFSVGKKYLIYAGGKEPISANRCSRTKLLDSATEDLKALGEGKKARIILESN